MLESGLFDNIILGRTLAQFFGLAALQAFVAYSFILHSGEKALVHAPVVRTFKELILSKMDGF